MGLMESKVDGGDLASPDNGVVVQLRPSANGSSVPQIQHVHSKDMKTFALDLLTTAFASALMYWITKKTLRNMDPTQNSKKTEADAAAILSRLGERGKGIDLDAHERILVGEVTLPEDIPVAFKDIGGLATIKAQLIETILVPLSHPELFARTNAAGEWQQRKLVAPPRGVLFYGPPGNGKTLTAKAIARDSGATFINLRWSTIKNKWYGESQKLVRAIFTLAHKLAPTIIFVDEAECFLGQRKSMGDHEETAGLKAEFMSLWDGLTTDESTDDGHVLVLCATNRPWDLDEAILRRMPRTFEFCLPDVIERRSILTVLLLEELVDETVELDILADMTENYSGSDLKELSRFAAMIPIRAVLRAQRGLHEKTASMQDWVDDNKQAGSDEVVLQPRALSIEDFVQAMEHVRPSGSSAREYKLKRMGAVV